MAQNIESWSYNLSAVTDGTDTSCEAKYVYNAADSWSPPRPVCMNAGYINLGYGYSAKVGYEYRETDRGKFPDRDRSTGLLPPKPYLFRKLKSQSVVAKVKDFSFRSGAAYGIDCTGQKGGGGNAPSFQTAGLVDTATTWGYRTPPAHLVNRALSKIYDKIGDKRSRTFDAAVFYGERKDTIRMLQGRSLQLLEIFKAVKSGKFAQAQSLITTYGETISPQFRGEKKLSKKRLKNLMYKYQHGNTAKRIRLAERTWLEMRYGWLPFIGEMSNLIDDFMREKPTVSFVVRARFGDSQIRTVGDRRDFGLIRPVSMSYSCDVKDTHFYRLSAAYEVLYNYSGTDLVSQLEGLGVLNPIATLWELVPLSFVVDWFVNVGDVLSSLTATAGLKQLYVCESYKFTSSVVPGSAQMLTEASSVLTYPTYGFLNANVTSLDIDEEFVYFHRKMLPSLPQITLSFDPNLKWMRIIDSLALIGQFTSKASVKVYGKL